MNCQPYLFMRLGKSTWVAIVLIEAHLFLVQGLSISMQIDAHHWVEEISRSTLILHWPDCFSGSRDCHEYCSVSCEFCICLQSDHFGSAGCFGLPLDQLQGQNFRDQNISRLTKSVSTVTILNGISIKCFLTGGSTLNEWRLVRRGKTMASLN